MEYITERRLRHIIRETLGEESAGLGPATGPAAEQEGEFDPPPGPPKRGPKRKPDLYDVINALIESKAFNTALDRFKGVVQSVIKRELAGRVPNLSAADVSFALQLDGDFDMALTMRLNEVIAEVLIEELPSTSPSGS